MITFYSAHFPATSDWVRARLPYGSREDRVTGSGGFAGEDYVREFAELKAQLAALGTSVPPLYKQYSELCEPGGVQFAAYNIDPDFADCVDGLVMVDIELMKPSRRKRYLDAPDELPLDEKKAA